MQYDVVLDPLENKKFVHHFILYRCPEYMGAYAGKGAACFEQPGEEKRKRVSGVKVRLIACSDC